VSRPRPISPEQGIGNVVDQQDGMLRIKDLHWAQRIPSAGEPATVSPLLKPMRAVRTSDSTLCTLSDDCSEQERGWDWRS
jgi:hypothetical protein